jgi:hypothetical protein
MTHALRLSTALALSMGLCGAVLAQNTAAPGAATPPEQVQQTPATPDTNAGVPKEQMQQGAGTPSPNSPNTNLNTNAGMPNTTGKYDQEANLSPDTVKEAQQQLKSGGFYKGAIDGRIGPETRDAVRKFQQQQGLSASSKLDQETLRQLIKNSHG